MSLDTVKLKKLLIRALPYILIGLVCTNLGEAWRIAEGANASEKLLSFFTTMGIAFGNPLPSFHPIDLMVGLICGAGLRAAVYIRGKNAKNFKHNLEYGSARWGGPKDIEPFIDPVFENNVILTKTERLMMSNRPKNPANARNKNVLIVGGSGSGKTRFWIKPNLLQLHSSYVLTDPKGTTLLEVGNAFVHANYRIKIFNTINFHKSIHQSEKRLAEIGTLKKHIINYSKTRAIYEEYRKAGYSKKFLEAHREEITIHKAAKAAFDELGVRKLPRVKDLSIEYAEVLAAKKQTYAEYRLAKSDAQELLIAQQNIASLYDAERKEEEQKRRKDEQSH